MEYDHREAMKLKHQLCFPLYAAARCVVNLYTPLLKPLGLTYTQYIVLMVLWEHRSVNVGQLGATLLLDAGTLTPLLKRMEQAGLVTRARSAEDERVTIVTITKKGEALKEKCKDIPLAMSQGNDRLTDKEQAELYRILYKLLGEGGKS